MSSDGGYSSDDGLARPFRPDIRRIRTHPQHLDRVLCRFMTYVRLESQALVCLDCYSRLPVGSPQDELITSHMTHNFGGNMNNHGSCFYCMGRLFLFTPQRFCTTCNRV